MRIVAVLVIGAALTGGAARAEILRHGTRCSIIASIMDGDDRQMIGYAVQFLADAMSAADENSKTHKRSGTFDKWSDEGLTGAVAFTIAQCRSGKFEMAKDAASFVMEDFRRMNVAFGLAK